MSSDDNTYVHDMPSLANILHTFSHTAAETIAPSAHISNEEQADIVCTLLTLMYDYVAENPTHVQNPTFHADMMDAVEELIQTCEMSVGPVGSASATDAIIDPMIDLLDCAVDMFYSQIMPMRSTALTETKTNTETRRCAATKAIARLNAVPQMEQRSNEWYAYRHTRITASNASKIFDTPGAQNTLIYEKCAPLTVNVETRVKEKRVCRNPSEFVPTVNITSPLHWGNKYEPVSVMYYELMYDLMVGEYGCIQHETIPFLGASPDGIVNDKSSDKYGQMLEIKNIVNRDITGVPAKAYWVQMQLQMEVCDLDECDFLETRFKEYGSCEEFMEDSLDELGDDEGYTKTRDGKWKGIMLYFIDSGGVPVYEYKPIQMGKEAYDSEWESACKKTHANQDHRFMWPIYWWLEEVSCVLVERNRIWFSLVLDEMSAFWDIIVKERVTGYAHRAPKSRGKAGAVDDVLGGGKCLITMHGTLAHAYATAAADTAVDTAVDTADTAVDTADTAVDTADTGTGTSTVPTKSCGGDSMLHIRTQSFDESIVLEMSGMET